MVGIVSRFVAQKGFDLIQQVADRLAREEPDHGRPRHRRTEYEDMFRRLNKQYPQKFAVKIAYDNALAHKIEAGSDMFLMPSHYEPCGMNQIYSLRYGTVPIVRAVGGLDDTVEQFDPQTLKGTGFKFKPYSGEALLDTLQAALKVYRQSGRLADADAQRHGAGLLLAQLRPRVREGVRAGAADEGSSLAGSN